MNNIKRHTHIQSTSKRIVSAIGMVAIVLLATPSVLLVARPVSSAILYPKGNVTVNGVETSKPVAIFTGDKIETTSHSIAALAYNGKISFLSGNSTVVFGQQSPASVDTALATGLGSQIAAQGSDKTLSPHKPCHSGQGDVRSGRGDADKVGDSKPNGNNDCDDRPNTRPR